MLQAYIDDTKKHFGARRLILAGYVNTAERWVEFSNAWRRALDQEPRISYFKAAEAEGLRGQFGGWGKLDRELKVLKLARIICRSEPWSLHVSVDLKGFDLSFKRRGMPYGFQTPYWVAFEAFAVKLSQLHQEMGLSDPVDLMFDEQNQISRSVLSLYDLLVEAQPPQIKGLFGSTPIFRSDKEIEALQAADMLAWHIQRETQSDELILKRQASPYLIRDGRHRFIHLNKPILKEMSEGVIAIHGARELSPKQKWKKSLDYLDGLRLSDFGD